MTSEGSFLHPNTKITDWLPYPPPAAFPVTPGFCHHWGHTVKGNPNQLELDQVEAESSNKIQHGYSPGNQGLCISTHPLCPTLGPQTDLPVTVTSPHSWPHPHQHCHPPTCAVLLSKAVQHTTSPSPLFNWKDQALFEEVSVNSVWLYTVLFPKGSNAEIPSAVPTGQLCKPPSSSAEHFPTSMSWNAAVTLIISKGEQTWRGQTKALPSAVTLHTCAGGCCSHGLSRLVHNNIGVIEDWASRALLHVHRSGRWGTR